MDKLVVYLDLYGDSSLLTFACAIQYFGCKPRDSALSTPIFEQTDLLFPIRSWTPGHPCTPLDLALRRPSTLLVTMFYHAMYRASAARFPDAGKLHLPEWLVDYTGRIWAALLEARTEAQQMIRPMDDYDVALEFAATPFAYARILSTGPSIWLETYILHLMLDRQSLHHACSMVSGCGNIDMARKRV